MQSRALSQHKCQQVHPFNSRLADLRQTVTQRETRPRSLRLLPRWTGPRRCILRSLKNTGNMSDIQNTCSSFTCCFEAYCKSSTRGNHKRTNEFKSPPPSSLFHKKKAHSFPEQQNAAAPWLHLAPVLCQSDKPYGEKAPLETNEAAESVSEPMH